MLYMDYLLRLLIFLILKLLLSVVYRPCGFQRRKFWHLLPPLSSLWLSEGDDPLGFDMPLVEDNMVLQGDWLNDDNFSYGGEGFIEDALTSQDNWLWDFCGFDGVGFQHASLDGHGLLATMVAMLLARSLLLSSLGRAKRGNQNTGQKGSSCRLY
ncbi:uncharacterized protein LOC110098423 isoform X5 [Dendrobium catenatum]|uniref:uncharacterized protein LOC110098423 isoform X5 n=1 Tax=Dendrobium catenatum TaxID=906689 RepID=UPI00109F217D|nr:uncharacterized protein LOC110098423 isoform X5 [Dendrobium catenatum]